MNRSSDPCLFAEADGRGSKEQQAFAEVSKVYNGKAASLRAICWFLYWGLHGQHAQSGFKAKKKGASPIFEYTFLYGFLFYGLINLVSMVKPNQGFSAAFGVVLVDRRIAPRTDRHGGGLAKGDRQARWYAADAIAELAPCG